MRYAVCQILLALLLVSCSDTSVDDGINGNNTLVVYSTVEDLPPCTIKNEGEQLFVKSEGIIRVCADEKWFATMERGGGCSTEMLKDSSGLKIVCDGDSVGVVLNGKNGSNGKNGILPDSSENDDVVLDSEKVATSLEGVSGYSQKGPFINGSKVTVIELESGRTLNQTGNTFESKIQSDDGQFKLNARMMVSQYVELHAEGYYRNEVSGGNSEAPLTLYALTDVRKRDGGIVNINLLTHLEYHRVVYLVKNKKMKVAAAKDSAEKEIFGLLNINSKDFFSSEDLNIAGSSEGDAALLAFSVMFQGNRGVADLTKLLTDVATDIEKDGSWDDVSAKAKIADWAENADATGRLETIRANVEDWGLSSMVPNFEKYIRSFWTKEYGLPTCDKDNVDKVVAAGAERLAESKNRFVCVDSARVGYMWRRATNLEKDTYGWPAGTDGQIKSGDINTSAKYVYDSVMGHWREMTELEEIYGFCNEGVESDSAASVKPNKSDKIGNEYYPYVMCTNRHWEGCSAYYADTRKYPSEASDGSVRRGDYTTNTYVFDTNYGFWRVGWSEERDLGQGCTASNHGQVVHFTPDYTDADFYYSCRPDSFLVDYGFFKGYEYYKPEQNVNGLASDDEHWVQTQFRWHEDNYEVGENTFTDGAPCNDGDMMPGLKTKDSYFVCDGSFWRAATIQEEIATESCTKNGLGFIYNDSITCEAGEWHLTSVYDYSPAQVRERFFNTASVPSGIELGILHDDRDGRDYRTIKVNIRLCHTNMEPEFIEWMAENLNFVEDDDYPHLKGHNACYKNDSLNCLKSGRFYTWAAAMNINDKWNNGVAANAHLVDEQHKGVCPEGWHVPTETEWSRTMYYLNSKATDCSENYNVGTYPVWSHIIPKQAVYWDGSNDFGFNALYVGGYYYFDANDLSMPDESHWIGWWSSNESDDIASRGKVIATRKDYVEVSTEQKKHGLPVRCVRNHNLTLD